MRPIVWWGAYVAFAVAVACTGGGDGGSGDGGASSSSSTSSTSSGGGSSGAASGSGGTSSGSSSGGTNATPEERCAALAASFCPTACDVCGADAAVDDFPCCIGSSTANGKSTCAKELACRTNFASRLCSDAGAKVATMDACEAVKGTGTCFVDTYGDGFLRLPSACDPLLQP